ncbi:MAG: proline dehydrogenase family protein [Gaiellales bacterium]
MRLVDRAMAAALPAVPRPVVRRFANRYMAGETLQDAMATVRSLNDRGVAATVDVLGEFITDIAQADAMADQYVRLIQAIAEAGLDSHVSVKLSALGAEINRATAVAHAERVVAAAAAHGTFVRIDMEHSGLTDSTLAVFRELREGGHENVGVVLQSYLRRSMGDVRALADLRPNVRLVKGIYVEPRRLAYTDMAIINRNFVLMLEELLRGGSYVAVATHDERLVFEAQQLADRLGLGNDRFEFQMLLGVDEELRDLLVDAGHRVRVYVPYGEAWYGYSLRRLKENPSIAGYVARDVLRSLTG